MRPLTTAKGSIVSLLEHPAEAFQFIFNQEPEDMRQIDSFLVVLVVLSSNPDVNGRSGFIRIG